MPHDNQLQFTEEVQESAGIPLNVTLSYQSFFYHFDEWIIIQNYDLVSIGRQGEQVRRKRQTNRQQQRRESYLVLTKSYVSVVVIEVTGADWSRAKLRQANNEPPYVRLISNSLQETRLTINDNKFRSTCLCGGERAGSFTPASRAVCCSIRYRRPCFATVCRAPPQSST